MQHEITLVRADVRLRPLSASDAPEMLAIIEDEAWQGMSRPVPRTLSEAQAELESVLAPASSLAFAIERDGVFVGRTVLYDLVPQLRVEIGNTYLAREVRGTSVNPTAKLLLLGYAFEELGMHRVALRCDSRNARSHRAIRALGAQFEGTLRGFRRGADGSLVDVDYFSVLRPDWPQVRERLLTRLEDGRAS